jgi:hypothetical protein
LKEERRLRVFENWGLWRVFGAERDGVTGEGKNYIMRSLMICTANQILLGDSIEKNEMDGACSAYEEKREACTGFWWGNLRERDNLGEPGVDGRIILRWIFSKWVGLN